MRYVTLGRTGLVVSRLGLGTDVLHGGGITLTQVTELAVRAWELGITLIDTDRWYGVLEPVDDLVGYRLVGLSEVYTDADAGTCGSSGGTGWDPDTLVTRACGRDELAGAAVWVGAAR